ncbi:MAG: exodeoxyribonuclease VII large subunit [Proteobacteria bacterium]|nr:exodeoxyribonuclease VII large subunit [Pseudomonadota bacterium]
MKTNQPPLPFIKIPSPFSNLPIFSISELREHISKLVKSHFSTPIIIKGVISSEPKLYPSFVFFDIRDEQKNMSFTLYGYIGNFYNIQKKLKATGAVEKLTEDVPVMLIVEPVISSQKNISIRLNIVDIIPEYTTSILASAKNITLNKLTEEGLVDLQKNIELPLLIRNIGLITSDQGTSVQDISSAMGPTRKFYNIIFQSVRVEGSSAVSHIVEAIEKFNKYKRSLDIDVLLIARGGGSSLDLAAFNDYELCKAVCLSKIPIITAIGHDKDEHAVELCSHLTPIPSTPSGIGTFLKQRMLDVKEDLEVSIQEVASEVVEKLIKEEVLVKNYLSSVLASIKNAFRIQIIQLKNVIDSVARESKRIFDYSEERVKELIRLLDAYNHTTVLKRGYSVVWDKKNKVVKSKHDMPEEAKIEFHDGKVCVKKTLA